MEKKTESVPFFAKKVVGNDVVVRTGVRAGATNEGSKKLKEEGYKAG